MQFNTRAQDDEMKIKVGLKNLAQGAARSLVKPSLEVLKETQLGLKKTQQGIVKRSAWEQKRIAEEAHQRATEQGLGLAQFLREGRKGILDQLDIGNAPMVSGFVSGISESVSGISATLDELLELRDELDLSILEALEAEELASGEPE